MGGGGTPHISIWVIWSDVQTWVGTPHKILRCLSSKGGGTLHILFEGIWLDIQIRVGTPHTIQRTILFELFYNYFWIFLCFRWVVVGWVGGTFRKSIHFVAPSCKLKLAIFSAKLRIQDGARVWQKFALYVSWYNSDVWACLNSLYYTQLS